ncbi:hypothetical protein VE01_04627 [Pseudogymnoascus verrucosus]|uniref:PXA domain-containing protein n=1 Tax=Pseudogymnoascus verrucosus TaxID=342668 RepID=A0A1B8GN34_9PEZI|nr:uncharacterized protein VE01_04627 [Pseudogymnoascus verrucosus]OBT97216.1 hypothetical protein VE01_04627 [Pseudogymnoascus verrucosus]
MAIIEDNKDHQGNGSSPLDDDSPNGGADATPTRAPAATPDATTRLLQYLAHASPEQLCAIAVGLAGCTYLILGRVGLVLIGAFGGIILHASWERHSAVADIHTTHPKQNGLHILQKVLDWREKNPANPYEFDDNDDTDEAVVPGAANFDDFRPATAEALRELVEATIRDYVKYWYLPVLPEEKTFPRTSQQTLVSFLRSIANSLSKKRPADAFLDFFTNCSSIVIVFLGELSTAILASPDFDISPEDAVQEYLTSNPDSHLAHIMDEKQQQKKFQLIANDLLQNFIEKSVYSCNPARVFLERILSGVVMEMSLRACSKPEWINGWIVYLLEEGEPDIIQAIDAGMGIPSPKGIQPMMDQPDTNSQKRVSRADDAMKSATEEAERLSQLIAEDESRQSKETSRSSLSRDTPDVARVSSSHSSDGVHVPLGPIEEAFVPTSVEVDAEPKQPFTSFDQIAPQRSIDLDNETPKPLTLEGAGITIMDDASPGDNSRFRNKPTGDYLVQIEPNSSRYSGWMIVRKYADFETLHEVLKRIAQVSGVIAFTQTHSTLPTWKNQGKADLRTNLENYLRDACRHAALAESVGMKRFLEKEQSQSQGQSGKGFGWPSPAAFETMGKGLVDNLMSASKGAAEGGKTVFGGMTGVLGNINPGRGRSASKLSLSSRPGFRSSSSLAPELDDSTSINGTKPSSEEARNGPAASHSETAVIAETPEHELSSASTPVETPSNGVSDASMKSSMESLGTEQEPQSPLLDLDNIVLPPPPSDMPDDYGIIRSSSSPALSKNEIMTPVTSTNDTSPVQSIRSPSISEAKVPNKRKDPTPFTEEETRVALELTFAMINELYTLSSVWNIRRTLLTAAKTFLLRPGNPSLASIQALVQESVITSNTSDAGIASHLRKIRENTMPTEEELKAWPEELSAEEKTKLRVRARKLLIERGIPPALAGVMGQAATGEAVGRVFDCLQDEKVARGLMFGLLLQGARAITH